MIDHLDDLEADFLRFYGIEEITDLDGPRFFRLAWRVSAYGGVMQMRLEAQQPQTSSVARPAASPAPMARSAGRNETTLDGFMLMFPGAIERATAPKDADV